MENQYIIILLVAVIVAAAFAFQKRRRSGDSEAPFEFDGSPNNDKILIASDATESDVAAVIDEFSSLYHMIDWAQTGFRVEKQGNRTMVRFPRDFPAELFIWLVNFLRYPIHSKPIEQIFGISSLDSKFGDLGCPALGMRAAFFIPDPDPRGDVVRILTEDGRCWDYTWDSRGGWDPVQSDRPFEEFRAEVSS